MDVSAATRLVASIRVSLKRAASTKRAATDGQAAVH